MFSIIILFNEYMKNYSIKKFFQKLNVSIKNQKEIELIFIIDNNYEILNNIQEFQNENPNLIVKFIFSTKKSTLNKMIKKINKLITNDYFFFLNFPSKINIGFFNTVSKIIESENPDIIEFKPILVGDIKWNPKDRINNSKMNKTLKLSNNKEIISYSFPFIFNKIFSTNLLNNTIKYYLSNDTTSDNSNILFTYFTYLLFLKCNKYYYIPNHLIDFEITNDLIIDFRWILSQWEIIYEKYLIENKYLEEIAYAKLYYLKIILCSLYLQSYSKIKSTINRKNNKNDLGHKKYQEKLEQIIFSEFKDFYLKNKYMVGQNQSKEVELLKLNYPISKWSKLLKELEG